MSPRLCKKILPGNFTAVFISLAILGITSPVAASEQSQESLTFNYSYENLNNGQPVWRQQTVQWQSEKKKDSTYIFEYNRYDRFNQTDISYSGQYISFINPDWYIDTTLAFTPDAVIIKKHSAQIWSHRSLAEGLGYGIGLNFAAYPTSGADVRTGALMGEVEKYISDFRFAYRLTGTNVNIPGVPAQTLFSHMFTSAYYYADNSNLSITLASGSELENDGSVNPPVSQISAFSIRQVHQFKNQWQSIIGLNWHRQGSLYIRSGISIGFTYDY